MLSVDDLDYVLFCSWSGLTKVDSFMFLNQRERCRKEGNSCRQKLQAGLCQCRLSCSPFS